MSGIIISIGAIVALLAIAGYSFNLERSRAGLFLLVVLTITALLELFDLLSLTLPARALFWKECALVAESFLPLFWVLCSLTFARQPGPWKIGRLLKAVVASTFLLIVIPLILPLSAFYYAPDFPGERILFLADAGVLYYIIMLACLVLTLVNLEVTLGNASPDALSKIKFEIIGLGTIVSVQAFYFSQALLYRTLNMNYLPLRSFIYLVAAALMAYSFAVRRSKVRIQVSRQVAFKSFVLLAFGVYLVMLGILGEGMRHLGVYCPRGVTISLAFLLGIAMLIMLLSEQVRRGFRVALHKNFYQHKHDYRTQWLNFTEQLSSSSSGDELLQRILSAYCDIFGIKGAALFLYETNCARYCLLAAHNMELQIDAVAEDNSLVRYLANRTWVISTAEDNAEITEEDSKLFRANNISFVVPIIGRERLNGFIVLGPPINRKEVCIYEDYDLMKTISRQASLAIMHQRLSEQITQAREIEAIGNVATFVAHDLKNLVSNLSLIVENAARHLHNPDFQGDMLMSLGNTVSRMQKMISRMNNLGEHNYVNKQHVNLLELAEKTARLVIGGNVEVSGTAVVAIVDENEILKIVLNLVMNGIEASAPDELVTIEVGGSDLPFIRVTDKGCGMPPHYLRTELFKPFKTTKKQGLGIGLYQCQHIIEAHGGRIEVSSEEGKGSVFTVWFASSEKADLNQ